MTKQQIDEILFRMNDNTKSLSSDSSISFNAYRDAELVKDVTIVPYLESLISKEKDKEVRRNIYFVLSHIGKNTGFIRIGEILTSRLRLEDNKYVLSALLDDIERLDNIQDSSEISQFTCDTRWLVRHSAILALGSCKTSNTEELLLGIIDNAVDFYDISYALWSLLKVGTKKCIPRIIKLLEHPKEEIRGTTVGVISVFGDASHLPIFLNVLEQQKSSYVKGAAIKAINKYGDQTAVDQVYKRVKAIISKKRKFEELPKSELDEAIEFLSRYYNHDERIKHLFNDIKQKRWMFLFSNEQSFLENNISYFKYI